MNEESPCGTHLPRLMAPRQITENAAGRISKELGHFLESLKNSSSSNKINNTRIPEMKSMSKTLSLAGLLFGLPIGTSGAATLLYSETFDLEAANYNSGTTPETNVGGIPSLQSTGTAQGGNLTNTAWSFSSGGSGGGSNGLRFGPGGGYNWALGANAGLILADGGFSISYDFDLAGLGVADDWMSVRVGNGPENTGIDNPSVDFGYLTRGDSRMQTFENAASNSFGTATAPAPHNFTGVFAFTSWAAGSTVNFTGFVDGVQIATDTFDWNGTDDVKIVFGGRVPGSLIDNIQIATIPEPSAALLSALGVLALVRRRRI